MTDLDPEVEALLAAVRGADDPEPDARRRVREALAVKLGAAALGAPALGLGAKASATGSSAAGAKAAGGVLSAAQGSATAAAGATAFAKTTASLAAAKLWIVCGMAVVTGIGAVGMRLSSSHEIDRAGSAPLATTPVPRDVTGAPPSRESSPIGTASESPMGAARPAPEQLRPAPAVPRPTARQPEGRRVGAKPVRSSPEPAARQAPAVPPLPEPSWQAELTVLNAAQLALRAGDPERALELAMQHAQRFPEGQLRRERWAVVALARCAGGQDGGEAARALEREAPGSALSERVRRACE